MYNVSFCLIGANETDIPEGTPVMFCPENTYNNYPMITIASYSKPGFLADMTNDHIKNPITADDKAKILMCGHYKDHTLMPWDFYFMYKGKTVDENGITTGYTDPKEMAKFYRVTDTSIQVNLRATRCWWRVNVDGVKVPAGAKPASYRFFADDNSTTGIDNVETRIALDGIYDLNGRKLDINPDDLPQGMFIINGKKVKFSVSKENDDGTADGVSSIDWCRCDLDAVRSELGAIGEDCDYGDNGICGGVFVVFLGAEETSYFAGRGGN